MIVIKKFVKNGCRPCAVVSYIIENLDLGDATVEETNIDTLTDAEFEAVQSRYHLTGAPTLVFERNGVIMERITGLTSADAILDALRTAREAK